MRFWGMSSRDEFPESVKRNIAARVNSRCSNPDCGAWTSGPQAEPDKALNIGVAAHIAAASPGGPRYDSNLTEDQRKAPVNGIWLCQNCAKLVDNDPARFPEPILWRWKAAAEVHALANIGRRSPFDGSDAPKVRVFEDEAALSKPSAISHLSSRELLKQLGNEIPHALRRYDQIELLDRGQGGVGQPYALVGLGRNHGWDWDIIFFGGGELGWEIVARTSLEGQKGYVPVAHYVSGTPGALVLSHVAGYGTGLFRRSTSWYVCLAKAHCSPR